MKISIIMTIRNRADLLKYNLEAISRQEYDLDDVEICISDAQSKDNLLGLIDRYSDVVKFKYCHTYKKNSYITMSAYNPAADYNVLVRWVASHNNIVKIDPEVVIKDSWVLAEIADNLKEDDTRMYNSRCHFTQGDGWYEDFDDILDKYERNYHYAEGGPFSRSKFYFCSGFSKERFIELRGVDELFCCGVGYDDTHLREVWKNKYGNYEKEITGETIHMWHGENAHPPSWETLNSRIFNKIKHLDQSNLLRLKNNKVVEGKHPWANPEMLSKIYSIQEGRIVNIEDPSGNGQELDLPF